MKKKIAEEEQKKKKKLSTLVKVRIISFKQFTYVITLYEVQKDFTS